MIWGSLGRGINPLICEEGSTCPTAWGWRWCKSHTYLAMTAICNNWSFLTDSGCGSETIKYSPNWSTHGWTFWAWHRGAKHSETHMSNVHTCTASTLIYRGGAEGLSDFSKHVAFTLTSLWIHSSQPLPPPVPVAQPALEESGIILDAGDAIAARNLSEPPEKNISPFRTIVQILVEHNIRWKQQRDWHAMDGAKEFLLSCNITQPKRLKDQHALWWSSITTKRRYKMANHRKNNL